MPKTRTPSESEKVANIEGNWKKATVLAWENTKFGPMDWLGMEATLQAYAKATGNHAVDEIVAAFTKRGFVLPCVVCGQEQCDCSNELRVEASTTAAASEAGAHMEVGDIPQDDDPNPIDDSVKCCPDCDRPNQFGEMCPSCRADRQSQIDLGIGPADMSLD